MLTENHIVSLLTDYLKKKGYKIIQSLQTGDKGIDIIAQNNTHVLYVEAKGETSSKSYTKRYGKLFSNNQIKSHVSKALLASMVLIDSKPLTTKSKVAIAFPDTEGHRNLVDKILISLKSLDIKVFWVSQDNIIEQ